MMRTAITVTLLALGLLVVVATFGHGDGASTQTLAPKAVYRWEPITLPVDIAVTPITALAVHPTDAYTVYLATWDGLYRTVDAGQSWHRLAAATLGYVPDMALAPSYPLRLYAVTWDSALYRSDDGGDLWTLVASPPSICGLSVASADHDCVYARGCGGDGAPTLFRSDDGGQTWMTPTLTFTTPLDLLTVSPVDPEVLIGADFDQVFRSADGGATWIQAPFGTRFFGKPVFDPQPPHTLYLGHWTGLLRSADGGATWQDSNTGREFTALIASPFAANEALGGDDAASWRIVSSGDWWSAAWWDAPLPFQALWRSVSDARVLYARSETGFWRYVPTSVSWSHTSFLPVIQRNWPGPAFPEAAQRALERLNMYRALAGAPPLRLYPAVVAAAQNHANYALLNHGDDSAWANGAHGEVPGKPGFTGAGPWDRMVAAGYPSEFPWWGGSEVMHGWGDPVASVDGWMASIYHRVISLDPGAIFTGYGRVKTEQMASDVMDFGGGPTEAGLWTSALPYPLAYPADGQSGVPIARLAAEASDSCQPTAAQATGYPFTLQGVGGVLEVDWAILLDSQGQPVAVEPNPPDCSGYNCYALIPSTPLQLNATYTVQARGSVGSVAFSRTWAFATGPDLDTAVPSSPTMDLPPFQHH